MAKTWGVPVRNHLFPFLNWTKSKLQKTEKILTTLHPRSNVEKKVDGKGSKELENFTTKEWNGLDEHVSKHQRAVITCSRIKIG